MNQPPGDLSSGDEARSTGYTARYPEPTAGAAERIRRLLAESTPRFIAPEDFDRASAVRDREYVRRLRELYWRKG